MKTAVASIVALTLAGGLLAQNGDEGGWDSPDAIIPVQQRVETNRRIEISAQVPGRIVYLNPNSRGGMVTEGEEVVRLDSEFVEDQYDEAKAKAESMVLINYATAALQAAEQKLQTKLNRNKRAVDRTGVPVFSEDEIRELELSVTKAAAELEKAKEDKRFAELARITKETELKQYTVRAKISGIVTKTHDKAVGSSVRQGDPIITITNLDEVHAVLQVSPRHESRINLGDTVLIRRKAVGVQPRGERSRTGPVQQDVSASSADVPVEEDEVVTFRGVVSYIGPSNFDKDNLMEVEARIKNVQVGPGKYMLREGSFIEARILSE